MHNFNLTISGRNIPVEVAKNSRFKRCSLRVNENGIRVTAPSSSADRHWQQLIDRNAAWILKSFTRQRSRMENMPRLVHNGRIPFKGEFFPVELAPAYSLDQVLFQDKKFVLPDKGDKLADLLTSWYVKQAVDILEHLISIWREPIGMGLKEVRLKNMRSRWGSCTAAGKVSLNWRLVMASETVFEYVFVHELCHLKARSHDEKFWNLVRQEIPNYNKHRLWLRKNGYMLTNFPDSVDSSATVASIQL